jgi:hypothetical protein
MVEIFVATAMEAAGLRCGGYGVIVFSFVGSSPLYIGSRRPPNDPLDVPYDLGKV